MVENIPVLLNNKIDDLQNKINQTIKEDETKKYDNQIYDFLNNWKISLLETTNNILDGNPQEIINEKQNRKYNQLFYISLTFILIFLLFIFIKFLKVLL